MTPEDQARMTAMYHEGHTFRDLAEEFGFSWQTAQRRLIEWGVELRPAYQRTAKTLERMSQGQRKFHPALDHIRALRDQGMSTSEIGSALGVPEEVIRERMVEAGIPRLPAKARPGKGRWKGGYTVDNQGYILVWCPQHPQRDHSNRVRMHRLVMEQELGRYLLPTEAVDHVNGDTSDNRVENLRLFATNAEHLQVTLTGVKKMPKERREELRQQAVRRATLRVAAIRAASESDVPQWSPPGDLPR